jgi:DHA2 family multidrug resistance protein
MLGVSVLFFFLFLAWERGEKHPVVDLSLFGYRNFVLGSAMISILYMTFVVSMVLYPTWMQTSLGYTATWSGLAMAPMGLGPLLLMPLIGQRLRNWDVRKTVAFGLLLFITAFYFHAQTSTDTTASYMASLRFFTGLAMPFSWMPLMVVALVGLPPDKLASAAGIFNFIRMLASSMGTAVGVTLWDQRSTFHHSRLVESLSADSPQYQQATDLLAQRLSDEQAVMAALDRAVTVQARTLGMDDIFYLSAAVLVPLLLLAWFLPASAATAEEST